MDTLDKNIQGHARASQKAGQNLWINFTCYVTPSPWWLQYVNSIWLQNSSDIGFAQNYPEGEQAQVDSEITYRDGIYYDFAVKRGLQFPFSNIYNHEPIYGREAHLDYTDAEFEKAFFWNACRGAALNELYISSSMMNEEKWQILTRVINWQKTNYHILRNAMFIGGNPVENNVYCYASWTEDGEGVIALRNPTHETAPLTLTLNKLMGCPESLNEVHRYNVLNKSGADTDETYNYNDKINLTLAPFEIKIFQFGKQTTDILGKTSLIRLQFHLTARVRTELFAKTTILKFLFKRSCLRVHGRLSSEIGKQHKRQQPQNHRCAREKRDD